ncbi:MAG: magnesium/cobalt transporter CorA [Candidatus Altiarchaeota archaeon]|nr:magnesium/cobalt transporter CorA [Candidatus Altiarchaeota archaeon]
MGKRTRKSLKAGLPPGTMIHVGERKTEKVKITVIDYDQEQFQEREVGSVEECLPFRDAPTVTWINVDGLHEVKVLERFGECFNLHPLVLEDIVATDQRPKVEDFGEYIFIVLKMLFYDEGRKALTAEQVSLILGHNFVLSFQEKEGDVFNSLRKRIKTEKSLVRGREADYLAYALIDSVVDSYFAILEKLGEDIEDIEDELVVDAKPETLQALHELKRAMIILRKSVWPLREIIGGLERDETKLIKKPTRIYLRDVYDHTIQVIDTIETYRDMVSGMLEIYLSSISNRMNEVMKVLTVIATIFIPLTFVVGVYGMNFNTKVSPYNMPELNWGWGYPAVWVVMILVAVSMSLYFKKKRWI